MLTTTVADPKAPVLIPGIGGSFAPLRLAVSVKVWADAGAEADPTSAAVTRALIQREVIRILLLAIWDWGQGTTRAKRGAGSNSNRHDAL
jgi:hypothetical protein